MRRALAFCTAVALLAAAGPSPISAVHALQPSAWTALDPTGPLLAVMTLLAWALAGWLAAVAALCAAAEIPGWCGRMAARCVQLIAPHAVRRLVSVSLGLTVALGTAGPAAAQSGQGPGSGTGRATLEMSEVPSPLLLDWPVTRSSPSAVPAPMVAPPAVTRPGRSAAEPDTGQAAPTVRPDPRSAIKPHPAAPTRAHAPLATRPDVLPAADAVVVQPGDCLWSLASRSLGPTATDRKIAEAWPTWWAANREVIGDDPHYLRPGMRLVPPETS